MKLWKRAMGFGVDCYQLEEKILVYSMFYQVLSWPGDDSPEGIYPSGRQGTGDPGLSDF